MKAYIVTVEGRSIERYWVTAENPEAAGRDWPDGARQSVEITDVDVISVDEDEG